MAALELKTKALSRRAALQALGASALAACVPRAGTPKIAGGIVGGNHLRGHRVREATRARPAPTEDVGIAILGGGIAGLSAAWAFERAGVRDFVVLELEDVPGGTARSGTGPSPPTPGARTTCRCRRRTIGRWCAVLEEMGAVAGRDAEGRPVWAEEVLCREPQERLFHGAHGTRASTRATGPAPTTCGSSPSSTPRCAGGLGGATGGPPRLRDPACPRVGRRPR